MKFEEKYAELQQKRDLKFTSDTITLCQNSARIGYKNIVASTNARSQIWDCYMQYSVCDDVLVLNGNDNSMHYVITIDDGMPDSWNFREQQKETELNCRIKNLLKENEELRKQVCDFDNLNRKHCYEIRDFKQKIFDEMIRFSLCDLWESLQALQEKNKKDKK